MGQKPHTKERDEVMQRSPIKQSIIGLKGSVGRGFRAMVHYAIRT
jgi:hypothetical protein